MRSCLLLAVLGASSALNALAQARGPSAGVRVVEVRTVPEQPSLGEPFELHLTVRGRGGIVVYLPDTLLPAGPVESIAPGAWSAAPAPGDSIEIRAAYPVMSFREGRVALPSIELMAGAAPSGGLAGAQRLAQAPVDASAQLERRVIRLGVLQVQPFLALAGAGTALVPRPAADVLGRSWSIWLVLAVTLAVGVGLLGTGWIARRWWAATLAARQRDGSPREEALRELERIRASGWHRNGRMDEFYASSTEAIRRFAARTDPLWGPALTSTELLTRLAERLGPDGIKPLAATVAVAERVKFGTFQPDAEAAEQDWEIIYRWTRDTSLD